MSTDTKPEALRLAEILEKMPLGDCDHEAAAELRRLHHENADLRAQLEAIGAGGVEPLRKTNSLDALDESSHPDHFRGATKMMQAARQALDALEEATNYTSCPSWSPSMTNECNAAITELREALEQPTQEAEPVAAQHRFRRPERGAPDWSVWQPCKVAQRPAWEIDSQGYEVEYRALYTAPQPARQPLTEGELDLILQKSPIKANYADLTALVRAVEKAHGIGGEV